MASIKVTKKEISFGRKRGPTINGSKPLLTLDNKERGKILQDIRKDWKELIRLHFTSKGGISDGKN